MSPNPTVARASGWTAALVYAANPNLLYLQATAMTEALSLALAIWAVVFYAEFVHALRQSHKIELPVLQRDLAARRAPRIGMNDSAAATILSRVEALQAELEETREQLRVCVETRISEEQIRSLHEHIAEQQETISYMQGTRVWKIGARYWRTREALRRRIGRH